MKRVIEDSILNDIAKAIQEKNGTDTKYEDVEMARAVRDISTAKEEQEKTVNITENGTTEVLSDENKTLSKVTVNVDVPSDDSHYDTFWDIYQNYGNRTSHTYAFYGQGWTDKTFKPKYDLNIQGSMQGMFAACKITNLAQLLRDCGVTMDTSGCTKFNYWNDSWISLTVLPPMSFVGVTAIGNGVLSFKNLHTVEKMIVKKENTYNGVFTQSMSLANILIEGEIGSDFPINASSELTAESAKSILTHLVNYKGTENESIYSITFHSDVWDRLDAEGETSPDGTTWKAYTDNKGWNY